MSGSKERLVKLKCSSFYPETYKEFKKSLHEYIQTRDITHSEHKLVMKTCLSESTRQKLLSNEVVLDVNRKNKFSRKESAYVSKMPLKNIENSQVYNTITNQLLVSQAVNTFEDALKKGELYNKKVPKSEGVVYPQRKREIMEEVPEGGYWRDLSDELQREYMGGSYFLGGKGMIM